MLAAATAVGSLGLAAGGTAAALLAVEMTSSEAAAGLPRRPRRRQAAASLLVARVTGRAGRGAGLVLGYGTGVLGALVAVAAALQGSFPVMLAGSCCWAAPTPPSSCRAMRRPTSPARAREGGRWGPSCSPRGTVAGLVLLVLTGRPAQALGLPRLAGLYLVSVAAFAAGLAVAALSRRLPELAAAPGSPGRTRTGDRSREASWPRRSVRPRCGPPCSSSAGPTWSWWRSWRWPRCG